MTVSFSVRAELVEALPLFFGIVPEEGQPFDKLRANGVGVRPDGVGVWEECLGGHAL
jgi:hypothetical protein